MNFLSILTLISTASQLAPQIVAGVEYIKKEAPGTTKTQLALDSLHLATAGTQALLPKDAETVQGINDLLTGIINSTVSTFNLAGIFTHKATPKPVTAAV